MFRKIIIFILALFLAAPVTLADDSSIIPVLWLFAINGNLDWQDWKDIFNDVLTIYQYNAEHEKISYFEYSGSRIYIYDNNREETGYFEYSGSRIYIYDNNREKTGYFEYSDPRIYIYDNNREETGYFEPFGPF